MIFYLHFHCQYILLNVIQLLYIFNKYNIVSFFFGIFLIQNKGYQRIPQRFADDFCCFSSNNGFFLALFRISHQILASSLLFSFHSRCVTQFVSIASYSHMIKCSQNLLQAFFVLPALTAIRLHYFGIDNIFLDKIFQT